MLVFVRAFLRIPSRMPRAFHIQRCAVSVLLLFMVMSANAQPQVSASGWRLLGDSAVDTWEANGDVLDKAGAHVELSASSDGQHKTASAITHVDATPFRLHTVKLSVMIDATDAPDGAGVWLSADGPNRQLTYATSEVDLVRGTTSGRRREIEVVVPSAATRLSIGVLLKSGGKATFEQLALVQGDALDPHHVIGAQAELDAALDIVKKHALRADTVDWGTVEPQVRAKMVDAELSQEAYPAIRQLLASLGDHHSFLMEPAESRKERSGGVPSAPPVIDSEPDGVGYIAMPGYRGVEPGAMTAFATEVASAILRVSPTVRCGWLVDLRGDRGGNMWPMLGGLKSLLGNGPLGYFSSRDGVSGPWIAGQGGLRDLPVATDLADAPVAMLIGPMTASSGEAVTIAFEGRAHTRFFGAPTAGLSTGNLAYKLPDGAQIYLTTTMEWDRHKHEYNGPIKPDDVVDSAATTSGDPVKAAAKVWLQAETGCSR